VYIDESDFNYFEDLIMKFDEVQKKKFLNELFKVERKHAFDRIIKIYIVSSETIRDQKIDSKEIITISAINKVYEKIKLLSNVK
jgi:hypothetical protein